MVATIYYAQCQLLYGTETLCKLISLFFPYSILNVLHCQNNIQNLLDQVLKMPNKYNSNYITRLNINERPCITIIKHYAKKAIYVVYK